jgi:ribosomal protein S18 acetylase RimI-like enzyme
VRNLITVTKATANDIEGIISVCSEGYRDTYKDTHPKEYIERVINEFYSNERVAAEVSQTDDNWNGWYVAKEDNKVLGAIGGGLFDKENSEIYVLYLDTSRRGEGIGTKLLNLLTEVQHARGAKMQWVSVAKSNNKGIPFYKARGFCFENEQAAYGNAENEEFISIRYSRPILEVY